MIEAAALSEKRSCYIVMTAMSRRYRVELMNYLHAVKRGAVDRDIRESLEEARRGYIASFAETQMTANAQFWMRLNL